MPQTGVTHHGNSAPKHNHHPDCSAVVILLLPDCPLRIGLSIYACFSQSFTRIGLLATVSEQRCLSFPQCPSARSA